MTHACVNACGLELKKLLDRVVDEVNFRLQTLLGLRETLFCVTQLPVLFEGGSLFLTKRHTSVRHEDVVILSGLGLVLFGHLDGALEIRLDDLEHADDTSSCIA